MNKKLIIISVIGLAGVGFYFYNKKKKETPVLVDTSEDEVIVPVKSNTSNTSTIQKVKVDWNKILKKGSKGVEVTTLQKALKRLDTDGNFGADTEKRLKQVTGLTEISVNQYNQVLNNLEKITKKQLKEAKRIKDEQKKAEAKKVVVAPKPTTSFTAGLITTL